MSPIKHYLFDQFRRPRGPLGHLAGTIMAHRHSNIDRNRWTVDLLDLTPDARVLEVGIGPGLGIGAALQAAPNGHVVGVDHASAMVATATRRHREAVRAGRVELVVGSANIAPALGQFDAIFSCNVWLFWSNAPATISRLIDALAPGGQLAITHLPRMGGPGHEAATEAALLIATQMTDAGCTPVSTYYRQLDSATATCVVGRRPKADARDTAALEPAAHHSPATPGHRR